MEEHIILSEKLEDQLKAVKWAREQLRKINNEEANEDFSDDNEMSEGRMNKCE